MKCLSSDDECVQKICWLERSVAEINSSCLYLIEPEERTEYNRSLLGVKGGKAETKGSDVGRRELSYGVY
jgi:hypothetical protein